MQRCKPHSNLSILRYVAMRHEYTLTMVQKNQVYISVIMMAPAGIAPLNFPSIKMDKYALEYSCNGILAENNNESYSYI